ncbi:MAG: hypothetical protein AAGE65_08600 [Planctomycetota bacterium]
MARKPTIPTYRLHRPTGQAVVTLRDARTGQRRDVYLGRHNGKAQREFRRDPDPVPPWEWRRRE